MMSKEYYRTDEVAAFLKISKKTVYNLVNDVDDPIPSIKIGSTLRIEKTELESWLERQKKKPWE